MAIKKLLFIDTNIWLDFYRVRTDVSMKLLEHAESIADQIIVTYQLETEYKKNRQSAIVEGMKELKVPDHVQRLGIFSDAKATAAMANNLKEAEKRVRALKKRLAGVLANPARNDPVYKVCQRIFHKADSLNLTREMPVRKRIRTRAWRRYMHGCPPRKRNDTSLGDAINWEWMIECAMKESAELVIVTRDSDYGIVFENKSYVNDHLRHEFSERVSKKRKLILENKLTDALKYFEVPVTQQETEAEADIMLSPLVLSATGSSVPAPLPASLPNPFD